MANNSTMTGEDLSPVDHQNADGGTRPVVPPLSPRRSERTGGGVLGRIVRFIDESQAELRKVTWPTRDQTINLTIVVITVCVFIGLLLGAVDYVFQLLVQQLII